jgi:hypothetical protein
MSQLPTRRSFLAASTAAAVGLMFKPAIAESQDLAGMTLQQARQLLRSKAVSPVDLTRAYLTRIERYNGRLDAFITVTGGPGRRAPAPPTTHSRLSRPTASRSFIVPRVLRARVFAS